MRVVTVAQMKQIEKLADANGVSYYQMMENAGTAAYHILRQRVPHAKHIAVVAGKGNNGGDGFVMARLAAQDGLSVTVILAEAGAICTCLYESKATVHCAWTAPSAAIPVSACNPLGTSNARIYAPAVRMKSQAFCPDGRRAP